MTMRVAVIGAGLSAVSFQRQLPPTVECQIFEKSRGFGGRMSTRRSDLWHFDHGAQYFTAKGESFRKLVDDWQSQGRVALWPGPFVSLAGGTVEPKLQQPDRFVGVPGMNAVVKSLAGSLAVKWQTKIVELKRTSHQWQLLTESGEYEGPFDTVVSTAPAQQSAELVKAHSESLYQYCQQGSLDPCWAVMVAFQKSLQLPFVGAFVQESPLSWVANNSSKPGRPQTPEECWVLHGTPTWSESNLESEPDDVAKLLMEEFSQQLGKSLPKVSFLQAHRWRYSIPPAPHCEGYSMEKPLGLAVCGDWCAGARVEGAFLSGMQLGRRLTT